MSLAQELTGQIHETKKSIDEALAPIRRLKDFLKNSENLGGELELGVRYLGEINDDLETSVASFDKCVAEMSELIEVIAQSDPQKVYKALGVVNKQFTILQKDFSQQISSVVNDLNRSHSQQEEVKGVIDESVKRTGDYFEQIHDSTAENYKKIEEQLDSLNNLQQSKIKMMKERFDQIQSEKKISIAINVIGFIAIGALLFFK